MKRPAVYILSNQDRGTLYTGVTSNLAKRVAQHKGHTYSGFTEKYSVDRLVWFEAHPTMESAIRREKAIKEWKRVWKLRMIENANPRWADLFRSIL